MNNIPMSDCKKSTFLPFCEIEESGTVIIKDCRCPIKAMRLNSGISPIGISITSEVAPKVGFSVRKSFSKAFFPLLIDSSNAHQSGPTSSILLLIANASPHPTSDIRFEQPPTHKGYHIFDNSR
jgi:hypothetical protein